MTQTKHLIRSEHQTPEHAQWRAHRQLLQSIPSDDAGYRGCIGMSLLIRELTEDTLHVELLGTPHEKMFMSDKSMAWATITDIPVGYFDLGTSARNVHWTTIRPTTVKFGVPVLARGTEGEGWNFHKEPVPHPTCIDIFDSTKVQLFRVFNAIDLAMTSTAFMFRGSWKHKRSEFNAFLKQDKHKKNSSLVFGDGLYDAVDPPSEWMPKPYLAFKAFQHHDLFDRVTRQTLAIETVPCYPANLRQAFVDALGECLEYRAKFSGKVKSVEEREHNGIPVLSVLLAGDRGERNIVRFYRPTAVLRKRAGQRFKEGEVLGEERLDIQLPKNWYDKSVKERWDVWTWKLVPQRLDNVMRFWFEREAVFLAHDRVHYSSQLAAAAALSSSIGTDLMWDVSAAMNYFREDIDACIFPTVQLRHWDHLSGVFENDIAYDFHPSDSRYETLTEQRERIDERFKREEEKKAARKAQAEIDEEVRNLEKEKARLKNEAAVRKARHR